MIKETDKFILCYGDWIKKCIAIIRQYIDYHSYIFGSQLLLPVNECEIKHQSTLPSKRLVIIVTISIVIGSWSLSTISTDLKIFVE